VQDKENPIKKGEQGLCHEVEELKNIFDSITDIISIHDRDNKIIRVNKAFSNTFKMKPEEAIGRYCYELIHNKKEPVADCPHRQAIETKSPVRVEFFEPYLKLHLEVIVFPILDEGGEVIKIVHIAEDITERKKVELEEKVHLDRKITYLETFNRVAMGREFKIITLKQKVALLEKEIERLKKN